VSQNSDDTPTGPIGARAAPTQQLPARAPTAPTPRWNGVRDLVTAALIVAAALLPWNLYFGIGIPGSNTALFALLIAVSVLALGALVGPWKSSSRVRLVLNAPYVLLVLAFVAFDVFETIRSGGTVHVPGGVGPGAWLGIAGALSGAQPAITGLGTEHEADDRSFSRWLRAAQITGYASIIGAALSFGFNLAWRITFAIRGSNGSSGFGKENVAVILTAVVYGAVAFVAVFVASRWLLRGTKAGRLATSALGLSTLAAGVIVWLLPVGREIDAFHGIAQNTSTAGVGYEGYLAWAAGAAIFAPRTLFGAWSAPPSDRSAWGEAARKGLALIAIWCFGSVLMRITDLVVAVLLNYPYSRYDTVTLAVFDGATGVLAIWLRRTLANTSGSARPIASLCGALATLTIARVIVGIMLAPRFEASSVPPNPVYGNNLAQQITSTFDVVLCGLALGIFVAAVIVGRRRRRPARRRPAAHGRGGTGPARAGQAQPGARVAPAAAPTTNFAVAAGGEAPTTVLSAPGASPRIFRAGESATRQMPAQTPGAAPKIYRRPDGP